jgi:hypothetical protein
MTQTTRSLGLSLAASIALLAPLAGNAATILLESDADRNANNELYQLSYNTRNDLFNNTIGDQSFAPLDINPLFSAHDFANDGRYNVLLESDSDRNANNEVYLVQYATLADFTNNIIASQFFLPLDVNPLFSIAGFTYAAGGYDLLLESDADRNGSNEVYFLRYDSFDALVNNTISDQFFLPLDINPLFSIGGFAYQDGAYQLLLESDADRNANNEVYFLEYDNFTALVNNTIGTQAFLPIDINPLFSVAGFENDYKAPTNPGGGGGTGNPPVTASEPTTWACTFLCFALLGVTRRRRGATERS